jgi:ATP-dependent RNA helicase SUPV3L1/SUV3
MTEAESTLGGDAPPSAPATPAPDWSDVRGFQVVAQAGAEAPAAPTDPEVFARDLAKELDARSSRFAQSVDESIVLASDGIIRWLGDPIARLIGGDDILKPRSVLLADEALAPEARQSVEARLALWIAAHIRKVLGVLEALAEPGEIGEPARELAGRVVQAFGVLERDRVRAQVKNLDQGARAALRKLGVRFGAFYIYVPSLLKPGARTLCSQLWSLRRGSEPGAERLLAFAASGRTSFPAEAPLGPETYRVAGFRLCGDRVVRVDIVERLTDLIRAANPDSLRGRPGGEAAGFVTSPQMTSLTGCAGDSFASILRSLGFESHRVRKTAYEATLRKPAAPAVAAGEVAGASAESAATDRGEIAEPLASELVSDAEPTATAPLMEIDEAFLAADEPSAPESIDAAPVLPLDRAPEAAELLPVAAEAAEPPPEPGEAAADEPSAPENTDAAPVLPLDRAPEAAKPSPVAAEAAEAPPAPEPSEAAAPAAEDEWIDVWRPAPRHRPPPPRRGAPAREGDSGRPPREAHGPRRRRGRDRAAAAPPPAAEGQAEASSPDSAPVAAAGEAARENRRETPAAHRHGGRRQYAPKGAGKEDSRGPEGPRPPREPNNPPPKKEPRAPPVDMDSPFAKLLALKPLLERRDKRT